MQQAVDMAKRKIRWITLSMFNSMSSPFLSLRSLSKPEQISEVCAAFTLSHMDCYTSDCRQPPTYPTVCSSRIDSCRYALEPSSTFSWHQEFASNLVAAAGVASSTYDTVQVQRAQQLPAVRKTVEAEFERELASLTVLGVEAKLRAKLEAVQQLTAVLHKESSAAMPSSPEVWPSSQHCLPQCSCCKRRGRIRTRTAAPGSSPITSALVA